jgi:hypothetical protein
MTINEAISKIDDYKSNVYSQPDKISWLSRLDGMIKRLIIDTHEGAGDVAFEGYNEDTDLHTELLVPHPFDAIYLYWLEAQIDYHNGELNKYNNSISMFHSSFEAFESDYKSNHRPISKGKRFLF